MHFFDGKKPNTTQKNYFQSTSLGALKLDGDGNPKTISSYSETMGFLGTSDIAYNIAGLDDRDIELLNQSGKKKQSFLDILSRKSSSLYSKIVNKLGNPSVNNKSIQPSFFEKNGSSIQKTSSEQVQIAIDQAKVDKWRKSLRVYFSSTITDIEKKNIILAKLSKFNPDQIYKTAHLSTFMVESEIYYNSRNQIFAQPKPVKILGFCYPDFRWKRHGDDSGFFVVPDSRLGDFWDKQTAGGFTNCTLNPERLQFQIMKTLEINLLAVIEEAIKTKQKLPFILDAPPAIFLSYLSDHEKYDIKKTIASQFQILKRKYSSSIYEHISEFIVLKPQQWDSIIPDSGSHDQPNPKITDLFKKPDNYHTLTHIVDANILDIVDELQKRDVTCVVPMISTSYGSIGNHYLNEDYKFNTNDEMLARATGGTHRAVFEGQVIKEVTASNVGQHNHPKVVETDPVFKTFENSPAIKIVDIADDKVFFGDYKEYQEFKIQGQRSQVSDDDNKIEFIKSSNQHIFSIDNDPENLKDSSIIDTSPIFTSAIKQAVDGLDLFDDFENNEINGKNLFHILAFANINQGVGNKIYELREFIIKKNLASGDSEISKFIEQAKTLSAKFQNIMKSKGILTGRYEAANPTVGARLHRMATPKNISQLLQNTEFIKKETELKLATRQNADEIRKGIPKDKSSIKINDLISILKVEALSLAHPSSSPQSGGALLGGEARGGPLAGAGARSGPAAEGRSWWS